MSLLKQTRQAAGFFLIRAIVSCAAAFGPAFHSATIRAAKPDSPTTYSFFPGGRFLATNVSLGYVAGVAFQSDHIDTKRLPPWTATRRFDVEATPDLPLDSIARVTALRALLEERFRLRYHRETIRVPRWSLSADRDPRLAVAPARKPSEPSGFRSTAGSLDGRDVSLSDLCDYLSSILGHRIMDQTKLNFRYDIHLRWQPAPDNQTSEPYLAAALRLLGLFLEQSNTSVETIVLDHVAEPELESSSAQPPSFEVATVKISDPSLGQRGYPVRGGPGTDDPTRILYTNIALKALLYYAYNTPSNLVLGPAWIGSERFDIAATIPKGATKEDVKFMLQSLLKERFQLVCHREIRVVNGFGLTVGPKGLKPQSNAKSSEGYPQLAQPGMVYPFAIGSQSKAIHLIAKQQTFAALVPFLSGQLSGPVVDETNLDTPMDFTLEFALETVAETGDVTYLSLPQALKEQLGLVLRQRKMDQERLVVDSASKVPSAN